MVESIFLFLINPPSRLRMCGALLSGASTGLIVIGLYLRIGIVAADIIRSTAKIDGGDMTLASLYPGLPTWCIPESSPVFFMLLVFCCCGVYAQLVAKKFNKYL